MKQIEWELVARYKSIIVFLKKRKKKERENCGDIYSCVG